MTLYAQNGMTANDRSVIRSATIAGTDVKVAVRAGPVGNLLLWAAARWHREVEPLRAPDGVLDCWGYAERLVRGSTTDLSNHAAGAALDLRARAHPLGTEPTRSYRPEQIAAIRRIVADAAPALRWGGDYVGRKDPMHLEVVADEATCSRVLTRLLNPASVLIPPVTPTPPEDDMQADERAALFEVRDGLRMAGIGKGRLPGRSTEQARIADDAFGWILTGAGRADDAARGIDALRAQVTELIGAGAAAQIDYQKLAAVLLPQLVAALTSAPR